MTRALVTGVAGFAGSHALRHILASTDWDVVCPVSLDHKGRAARVGHACAGMDTSRVTVFSCDLTHPLSAHARTIIGQPDYIVNYASASHVDRSITDPAPFAANNVQLMLTLLEFARTLPDLKAFIHVSTDEVYGPSYDGELHGEDDQHRPSNPYCLVMGTDVITRRGPIAIEDFSITEHRTLSRDGHHHNIPDGLARRTWQFTHTGPMLKIRTREGAEEITCTPEHKFFLRVNAHASGGSKMVERRAGDIKVGDRVCIVRQLPFPADLPEVQLEYARFLGYWIADGSYTYGGRNRYVRLADADRGMIEFYRSQALAVCGVAPKSATGAFGHIFKHGTKNCWYLQFASQALRDRIDLTDRMNVIDQALNFGPAALGQFVAGWLDGDGSIARERGNVVKAVTFACKDDQRRRYLKFMLRRLGIVARDDTVWDRVTITDARSLMALCEAAPSRKWRESDDFRTPQRKPGRAHTWMWARVESVEQFESDTKVYDLEVGKYHNYVASYFLVHNSASKSAQSQLGYAWWRTYGVPFVETYACNMFGEHAQDPEKFFPKVMATVAAGGTVPVHAAADGTPGSRFWQHARNVADAIVYICEHVTPARYAEDGPRAPSRFNITSGDRVSNLDLAKTIAAAMGLPLMYETVDYHSSRPGHDLAYGIDGSRLRALGWQPPVGFAEAVKRTVAWELDHAGPP